jgi:hypothetical protein
MHDVLQMVIVDMSVPFMICVTSVIAGIVIVTMTVSVQGGSRRKNKLDAKIKLAEETRIAGDTRLIDARSRPRSGE